MPAEGIPESVRALVDRSITSVEELELLLLLREERERSWAPEEAARQLRTVAESVRARLGELVASQLVRRDGDAYRYSADAKVDPVVGELARYDRSHRTRIITMIFDEPSGGVRDFADAFRLRRDR